MYLYFYHKFVCSCQNYSANDIESAEIVEVIQNFPPSHLQVNSISETHTATQPNTPPITEPNTDPNIEPNTELNTEPNLVNLQLPEQIIHGKRRFFQNYF